MILSIKATRRSSDLSDDLPNAGGGHIQGSQILEFEVPYEGAEPTVVVDCGSAHAFDMHQLRGEQLPRRACPLRPKGAAAGPEGPPPEWLETWYEHPPEGKERVGRRWEPTQGQPEPPETVVQRFGRIKPSVFDSGDPENPLQPSDRFSVVSVSTCNDCPCRTGGVVAIKEEQDAIRAAFHQQLQVEDFTGFDLTDEDRDQRRWNIAWGEIEIIG